MHRETHGFFRSAGHRLPVLALVGCLGLVTACGNEAVAAPGPERDRAAMMAEKRDPAKMVERLAQELSLNAAQKATLLARVQRLQQQAAPLHAQRTRGMKELARQVRAGRLDAATLERELSALETTMQGFRPELQAALSELHRTLSAEQRAALVKKMRERRGGHRGGFFGAGRHGKHGKHGRIAKELGLSDAQRDQLEDLGHDFFWSRRATLRKDRRAMHDQMKAAAQAFVSDSFDPRTLPMLQRGGLPPFLKMAREALPTANKALGLLTAAQRELLAAHIEKKADRPARGFGIGFGHGPGFGPGCGLK